MNYTIIFLIAYTAILAYITWSSAKTQTNDDYLNSSKQLTAKETTWTTFASLLTGYNLVLGVTFSYIYGLYYLFAFVGAALAFVFLYYFYKKELQILQPMHNLFSQGDYFGVRYGNSTKNITNILTVIILILYLTLQLFINTQLFGSILGISQVLALILTTGTVCLYLWIGGFKTSVRTDVLQGILMLPLVLTVFSSPVHFSVKALPAVFPEGQFWFAVGLACVQFLVLIAQAESFQRVFAVRDNTALKSGLRNAFILLAVVATAITYLGVNFLLSGAEVDPNTLFVDGVLAMLPVWLTSLLTISLIAAFMGTIDSAAFALGTILSNSLKRIRLVIFGSILLSAFMSLYLFSFLSSVFALISVISVIGTGMVVSMWKSTHTTEINALLITGTIVFVLGIVFGFVTDNPITTLIPSAGGLVMFFVVKIWNSTVWKQQT